MSFHQPGKQIVYVPMHAHHKKQPLFGHADVQVGFVTSIKYRGTKEKPAVTIYSRYWYPASLDPEGGLRTKANSEGTSSGMIYACPRYMQINPIKIGIVWEKYVKEVNGTLEQAIESFLDEYERFYGFSLRQFRLDLAKQQKIEALERKPHIKIKRMLSFPGDPDIEMKTLPQEIEKLPKSEGPWDVEYDEETNTYMDIP